MLKDFNIYDELCSFKLCSDKGLNIVSTHLNGTKIFHKLILDLINEDKKILYIVNGNKETAEISNFYNEELNKAQDNKDESLKNKIETNFEIVDFYEASSITNKYYLILFDDINEYPAYKNIELKSLINTLYSKCDKFISYSVEPLFKDFKTIKIKMETDGVFIVEPRFLNTTLDTNSSIPTVLYEFLEFFYKENRKVVILVPNNEVVQGMIDYVSRINSTLAKDMVIADDLGDEVIDKISYQNRPYFFITSNYREIKGNNNFDYIITNASLSQYTYKQFVFLSTKASLKEDLNGEVILVSKEISENMDRAKSITRDFNKELWENDSFR